MSLAKSQGDLPTHIVGEIRAEMARQRKTQRDVAERAGWTQSYLARRLVGRTAISLDDLDRIAHALGVPVRALVNEPERAA